MKKNEILFLLKSFLVWRTALFIIAFVSVFAIPTFGGRFPYYDRALEITRLPNWVWGFGNFDGVHYLRIAQDGYKAQYSQAFFPFYPILVGLFATFLPKNLDLNTELFIDPSYFYSGIILSNLFFISSLFVLYKFFRLTHSDNVTKASIILFLVFPTSFYFGAIYSESLFLLEVVSSLYFLRKDKLFLSGIFAGAASATRLFGILLFPILILTIYKKIRNQVKIKVENLVGLLIAPLGLVFYMIYLNQNYSDPLLFLTSQPIFGAGRTAGQIIFLPQVIFRYLKIFLSVPIFTLTFFNAFLEFAFTLVSIILLIVSLKKIRFSHWLFTSGSVILPTLTGTFSSMPRYTLMGFLLIPFVVEKYRKYLKTIMIFFAILGAILISLFVRGYWVA